MSLAYLHRHPLRRELAGFLVVGCAAALTHLTVVTILVEAFGWAALLANLDLLVSVDTANIHLAGALGRPAYLLLPFAADWRWLERRDDSPWYPSLRLLRQTTAGDWPEVTHRLEHALRLFVDETGWILRQQQSLDAPHAWELIFEARREDFSGPSTEQILEDVGLSPADVAGMLGREP